MKASLHERLQQVASRHEEVGLMLSQPEVFSDQKRFRDLSMEYAHLEPLMQSWQEWLATRESMDQAQQMLDDADRDLRDMAEEELQEAARQLESLEKAIQLLLLPKDPNDNRNIFLEIRAGTGGDEAAIFVDRIDCGVKNSIQN